MKDAVKFKSELDDVIENKSPQDLFKFMEENMIVFFSSTYIPEYYRALKDIDFSKSTGVLPKLIISWLAFLCGDHGGMFGYMKIIGEADLKGSQDSSMYYSLRAFAESMMGTGDGPKYAKLSLDVLAGGKEDFYLANAKLTYGQLLSSMQQHRTAAEMFASAYKIFDEFDMGFPAVVSLVNEVLNLYRLGEVTKVIDKCSSALAMSSRFKWDAENYWDVVKLPLGMCYYELNKPSLAAEYLKAAKECIDKSQMFHMHGLVELYLFKSYYLLGDKSSMELITRESIDNFEHMHNVQFDMLLSMFKVFSGVYSQVDIDKLELEYLKKQIDSDLVVTDTLVLLKMNELSDAVDIEYLQKRLEKLRYIGIIPQIQLTLLEAAELYYMDKKNREASNYLLEAVKIYKEYGISAVFHAMPFKSTELLKEIDTGAYARIFGKGPGGKNVEPKQDSLLSPREKEILLLVAEGMSNEEISKAIYIGVGTIKWHTNNIFGKLQVKNRIQAVEKAKSLGEI